MRLQSKKLTLLTLPPIIAGVFLFSLIYWLYLGLTTHMGIVFDSIDYASLGGMIYHQGWITYFTKGPNREPLYPLLIAVSMHMADITGLAYVKVMAIFGIMIMFLTQIMTYKILSLLRIRDDVKILVLTYLCLSPALNNSAFSLYSEIATYPFILGIPLTSFYTWEAIVHHKRYNACLYSMLLGILFTSATLIKGVFECITPIYLIIFFALLFLNNKDKNTKRILTITLSLTAVAIFFYGPITGYKWLNWHYNKNFTLTTRASWMIYGDTIRRVAPLRSKELAAALAYAPGEGFCKSLFSKKDCDFWSFQETDTIGYAKQEELNHQHLTLDEINATLLKTSVQKAAQNPFQYILLGGVEGLKMFFWESTQIGFVDYPHWLQRIYNNKIFNNSLRFIVSLATLIAVFSLWRQALMPARSPLNIFIGMLIFIYILSFSFVCILTRYALPLAPLYLIAISIWINKNLPLKN